MKFFYGRYYVEVKGKRYIIQPIENIILRLRDEPKSLRTQYQVQDETQIRKIEKVIKTDNDESKVKNYPKSKQQTQQPPKFKPPNFPSCKRINCLEIDKGYYCQNCENFINKQKHQIDLKIFRQNHYFSTRLTYANKKIREINYSMVKSNYNLTQDMINKLQSLEEETKLKFHQNRSNYYDEMNYRRHKGKFLKT